ncbi:MAG: hypothetical protein Q4B73_06555 [Lachnospiraceae bacterium]|nr:hypothetical protein [Lachnospiraceae bacterium]
MENKTLNRLFVVAILGLEIAGLIFVGLSIFGKGTSGWTMPAGFFCFVVGNIFILVGLNLAMKNEHNKK